MPDRARVLAHRAVSKLSGESVAMAALAVLLGAVLPASGGAHAVSPERPQAAATAAASGHPLAGAEIRSLRTRSSRTFRRDDGALVASVFSGPVNFRDADGGWRAIDNELVRATGGFRNRANRFTATLPDVLDEPVRYRDGEDWVSFELLDARGAAAEVEGNVASYADAFESASVRYTVGADALKEDIVLEDRSAPSSYRFGIEASAGLQPRRSAGGGVDFVDSSGASQITFAPPSMHDAAGEVAPAAATRFSLARRGGGWTLTLTADRGWINAAGRAFPVDLDPTIYYNTAEKDCLLQDDMATTSLCADEVLEAGRSTLDAPLHDHNSLVQFDVQDFLPRDAVVLDAELWLWMTRKHNSNQKTIGVHRVTRPWTNSATWDSYDGTNVWTSAGGDYVSEPVSEIDLGSEDSWETWDVTKLVSDWADGTHADNGLILTDQNPSVDNSGQFASTESTDPNDSPHLDIIYEPRVGQRASYAFASHQLNDRMGVGVNVANGNMLHSASDIRVPGVGLDLDFTRYHNSGWQQTNYYGQFGSGGTANLGIDVWLRGLNNGAQAYYPGSGSAFAFRKRADGTYAKPMGLDADLVDKGSGRKELTFRASRVTQVFQGSSLVEIKDPNGKTITFDYKSSDGALESMTDTQGRVFDVTTNADRYITEIEDPTGRTWKYAYGTGSFPHDSDHLVSYTDPAGEVTSYEYDSAGNLEEIKTPGGRETELDYDSEDRVDSITRVDNQTTDDGPTTVFEYDTTAGRSCADSTLGKTVVKDPLWSSPAPLEHTTTYCHNRKLENLQVLDGNGNQQEATYNPNGNATQLTAGGT